MNLKKNLEFFFHQIYFKQLLKILQVCIIAIGLLLFLSLFILSPISPIYSVPFKLHAEKFTLGVDQSKAAVNELLLYVWFAKSYDTQLSPQAVTHMKDVRKLFIYGQTLSLIVLSISLIFLSRKTKKQVRRTLYISTIAALCILGALALLISLGFDAFFTQFHSLLFTNELWLFPPNDSLILYLPQYFFFAVIVQLITLLVLCLSVFLLFLQLNERQERLLSSKPAQHI